MSFELLIHSYSGRRYICKDILDLITSYYSSSLLTTSSLNLNIFLLSCTDRYILNIANNTRYRKKGFGGDFNSHPRIIVDKTSLPNALKPSLKLNNPGPISSPLWSLAFSFYNTYPEVTLFNPDLLNKDNTYKGYRFRLTEFGNSAFGYDPPPAMTYSKKHSSLFISNATPKYSAAIHRLDLTRADPTTSTVNTISPEWEHVGNLSATPFLEYHRSMCMVDKDQFIACFSQKTKFFESSTSNPISLDLYALNCKRSIALKDLDIKYNIGYLQSIYHDKFHKIIICGKQGVTKWYDINMDKWMNISNGTLPRHSRVKQVWISENNPNMIYRTYNDEGEDSIWSIENKFEIQEMDLRIKNGMCSTKTVFTRTGSWGWAYDGYILLL